ncbi:MAG: GC-type dockerin domain-anchored protein [Phycisphaerales bacterium JB060]
MRNGMIVVGLAWGVAGASAHAQIFVGLEGGSPPTYTSDLAGFPGVSWTPGVGVDVSAAAGKGDGGVYLCNGAFTTVLYEHDFSGSPTRLATIDRDIHALAYDGATLYGYSNFSSTKGIYSIDPATGETELAYDIHTGTSFRFFALDYNAADGLLYGYTEYGDTGLWAIDVDAQAMTKVADPFPADNTQGRAMAIGDNTVYILSTRGADGVPAFAYDLSQGPGGDWVAFTNPYTDSNATGGAAWLGPLESPCRADFDGDGELTIFDFLAFQNAFDAGDLAADFDGDGALTIFDFLAFQNEFDAGC